jgi:hypothetical protein
MGQKVYIGLECSHTIVQRNTPTIGVKYYKCKKCKVMRAMTSWYKVVK